MKNLRITRKAVKGTMPEFTVSFDGKPMQFSYSLSRLLTDTRIETNSGIFSAGRIEFFRGHGDSAKIMLDLDFELPCQTMTAAENKAEVFRRAELVKSLFEQKYPEINEDTEEVNTWPDFDRTLIINGFDSFVHLVTYPNPDFLRTFDPSTANFDLSTVDEDQWNDVNEKTPEGATLFQVARTTDGRFFIVSPSFTLFILIEGEKLSFRVCVTDADARASMQTIADVAWCRISGLQILNLLEAC